MALEEVTYKRGSTIVSSRSDLFGESKSSKMQECSLRRVVCVDGDSLGSCYCSSSGCDKKQKR